MANDATTRVRSGLTVTSWLAGALLLLALPGAASALTITEWDIAGATGQTAAVLSSAADTSATIIDSVGVTQWTSTAQDGFIAARDWGTGSSRDTSRYYEFAVTANAGFEISYDTVTLALFRGIQSPDHGAEQWDLYASVDGFSSEIFLQSFDISSSAADDQIQFVDQDISALGAQQGTVTFRLFGYDYTSPTDYSGLANDSGWLIGGTGSNVILEGSVATVPEPGTAALVMLGMLGLGVAGRHRNFRAKA